MRNGRGNIKAPAGFTLVEMLVVISIVALLAAVVIPIALRYSEGRRARDAARTVQAMLAGARDQAMGKGFPVGVRFIQESTDRSIVRSMAYVQQRLPENLGKCVVDAVNPANPVYQRVRLLTGPKPERFKLLRYDSAALRYRGEIRFEQASRYYSFWTTDALLANTPPELMLDDAMPGPLPQSFTGNMTDPKAGADYKIPLESQAAEDVNPIRLPDGVVIDLGSIPKLTTSIPADNRLADAANLRLSQLPVDTQTGYFDILFSPSGQIMGNAAVESFLSIWIRDELSSVEETQILTTPVTRQKRVRFPVRGTHLLMTVLPRTGLVKSVDIPFDDQLTELRANVNANYTAPKDGFADFVNYAKNARGIVNANY